MRFLNPLLCSDTAISPLISPLILGFKKLIKQSEKLIREWKTCEEKGYVTANHLRFVNNNKQLKNWSSLTFVEHADRVKEKEEEKEANKET